MAQSVQTIKDARERVVGLKQTLRAIQQNKVKMIFLANDIEEHLIKKIVEACREKQITMEPLDLSQKELGKICQIEVGASVVALIEQ